MPCCCVQRGLEYLCFERKEFVLNRRKLSELGIPAGEAMRTAIRLVAQAGQKKMKKREVAAAVTAVVRDPHGVSADDHFFPLAELLIADRDTPNLAVNDMSAAPWQQWGTDIRRNAIQQMEFACHLPVARQGALMPDAHQGYGLPIGGVLAVEDAVIPYAVGTDIACRMCLSVTDMPAADLSNRTEAMGSALEKETVFGNKAGFDRRREHDVLDADWTGTRFLKRLKDKAWKQLGSSGGGNHFVEFGVLSLGEPDLGLAAGDYVALLSHSGSRGAGSSVAQHYSQLAREQHPELPPQLAYMAWLSLQSESGQEYWHAMQLMGAYAQANHEVIHRHVLKNLRAKALVTIQNHHNFAWREEHGGKEVIVHRKGAIPAAAGQLGVIPGSMAAPGYVVRGRGCAAALNSAAHGAGRRFSRQVARNELGWADARQILARKGVTLLSGSIDESPLAYKDIGEVMAAQTDLVDVVGRFQPKVVKMAP